MGKGPNGVILGIGRRFCLEHVLLPRHILAAGIFEAMGNNPGSSEDLVIYSFSEFVAADG